MAPRDRYEAARQQMRDEAREERATNEEDGRECERVLDTLTDTLPWLAVGDKQRLQRLEEQGELPGWKYVGELVGYNPDDLQEIVGAVLGDKIITNLKKQFGLDVGDREVVKGWVTPEVKRGRGSSQKR